ncbi:GLPGLI family protein [Flavobacterium sp. SM15]|uniref:GLPGLI family protein n=1 Tax=Flavobacterium sp. SM15 TaxID=2908005 RepID=UPI001EDA3F46|nr:GLPGLI family protein [Flavobacterium sp. SM15]MCG2610918.1 GLPGLI family protein [Flavobacterium sp. SM15]
MKKKLTVLFGLLFFFANSQRLQIKYDVQIDMSGMSAKPFNHCYLLDHSNGTSLQKKFLKKALPESVTDKNNSTSRIVKIGNDTTYVYKDFLKNSLYSEERIFTKTFLVADQLNIFSWKIEEDTLTVLKHKCRKATTRFRGREYIAYFAEDIPVAEGPGKFNGLPGLILKVMLVNSTAVFSAEAIELHLDSSIKDNLNPFANQKLTSFKDFKKEYNRKYAELESFSSEQSGGNASIKRGGLELLSDD